MNYPDNVWKQLKAKTCDDFISALQKDDWVFEGARGAVHSYRKNKKIVTIHRHPGDSYGPSLLKALLERTEWTIDDLRRLKLIKRG